MTPKFEPGPSNDDPFPDMYNWNLFNELRIDVWRSQNIIPVEPSRAFHLDFKESAPGVELDHWSQSILAYQR